MSRLNVNDIGVMAVVALATAAITWTISKSRVFEPFRDFLSQRWEWWYDLFSCPYCLSHYVSAIFSIVLINYRPVETDWIVVDYIISVFATVTLSTAFAGYLIRFSMAYSMKESEKIDSLTNALQRAKTVIERLRNNPRE